MIICIWNKKYGIKTKRNENPFTNISFHLFIHSFIQLKYFLLISFFFYFFYEFFHLLNHILYAMFDYVIRYSLIIHTRAFRITYVTLSRSIPLSSVLLPPSHKYFNRLVSLNEFKLIVMEGWIELKCELGTVRQKLAGEKSVWNW